MKTTLSRGTASYRAPELLSDSPVYTNKVDTWAFGCIFFEIMTGKRQFGSDWEVQQLTQTAVDPITGRLGHADSDVLMSIARLIMETLRVDWTARPTCAEIYKSIVTAVLLLIKSAAVTNHWMICNLCHMKLRVMVRFRREE